MPGSIVLGFFFALVMFDVLSVFEAAVLGTMLAATDAALGKAVVTNPSVPDRIREGLNVESGLNDGLCVPLLLAFIAMELGMERGKEISLVFHLLVREIGVGLIVGLGLTLLGAGFYRLCRHFGWVSEVWLQMTGVALAIACFAVAQSLHGSGYIAAFSGGLLLGYLARKRTHKLVMPAEGIAETLALLTWLLFGYAVIGQVFDQFTWQVILYAVLSLTVVRMLPIFLALAGSGESAHTKLFLGWFGPRGLASIVFAVIVLDRGLPSAGLIALVVTCTVFISLIVHGVTANSLSNWIARKDKTANP